MAKQTHTAPDYILNPVHPLTVALIGCGGTGSNMLTNLARINVSLKALGHPGIHVTAYDDDKVSHSNIGRQLFSPADVGQNKANLLISRINRFFGFDWIAREERFNKKLSHYSSANITVSCVDTAKARIEIGEISKQKCKSTEPYAIPFYWLDLGNSKSIGQVVLGMYTNRELPNVLQMFPNIEKHDTPDQGPSCSMAEALKKQDLFINSTLAQFGANLLWKLFTTGSLDYHGAFINLDTFNVNPIHCKSNGN